MAQFELDLSRISIREYRRLFQDGIPEDEEYAILGKVAGMTAEQIGALPYDQWRALVKEFFEAARNPLADPN